MYILIPPKALDGQRINSPSSLGLWLFLGTKTLASTSGSTRALRMQTLSVS